MPWLELENEMSKQLIKRSFPSNTYILEEIVVYESHNQRAEMNGQIRELRATNLLRFANSFFTQNHNVEKVHLFGCPEETVRLNETDAG